jgi:hypothetical protein
MDLLFWHLDGGLEETHEKSTFIASRDSKRLPTEYDLEALQLQRTTWCFAWCLLCIHTIIIVEVY